MKLKKELFAPFLWVNCIVLCLTCLDIFAQPEENQTPVDFHLDCKAYGAVNVTAILQQIVPECTEVDKTGLLNLGNVSLPVSLSFTSKGNGILRIPGKEGLLDLACYDSHDNGTIFSPFWAQLTLQDCNNDGYPDFVIEYNVLHTEESGQTTPTPIKKQYFYNPEGQFFE